MALVVTYLNEQGLGPTLGAFEIQVDGTPVGRFEPNTTAVGFYDATYPIPRDVVRGKSKVTVRFQAPASGRVVPVFGIRTVRASNL